MRFLFHYSCSVRWQKRRAVTVKLKMLEVSVIAGIEQIAADDRKTDGLDVKYKRSVSYSGYVCSAILAARA